MPLISNDRLSKNIACFSETESELDRGIAKINDLYGSDEPILGFEEINETLDDAEDRLTSNIIGSVWSTTHNWLKAIAPDLNNLDRKKIASKPLNFAPTIQNLLLDGWRTIVKTGARAGIAEINELNIRERENSSALEFTHGFGSNYHEFSRDSRPYGSSTNTLEYLDFRSGSDRFDDDVSFSKGSKGKKLVDKYVKRQGLFEVAYPPDNAELDIIEVKELTEALNLRTQVLAEDLSQDVSDRISRAIKDSIDLHYVKGRKVQALPKAGKTKLIQKITGIVNYYDNSSNRGRRDGKATELRLPNGGFVSRTKMIASTELNAGYNLGRLQTYQRTGVTKVRWQTINDSRTCKVCASRNGRVMKLSTVLKAGLRSATSSNKRVKYKKFQFVIPAHPFCRCAWQVASKEEIKDKKRAVGAFIDPDKLPSGWKAVQGAAGLVSTIGTAKKILNTVEEIAEERQLQEQSKRRAKNRALLAAGGALSLGVLSFGLWKWLNASKSNASNAKTGTPRTTPIADLLDPDKAIASSINKSQSQLAAAKIKRELEIAKQPLTPSQMMRGRSIEKDLGWNEVKQQKYTAFLSSGVDLKNITDLQLRTKYGLTSIDILAIRRLQREELRSRSLTSPYQKLLPASVLPTTTIVKYPQLAEIEDIRTLSLQDLLKKGIPKIEADKIYAAVYQKARSTAGLAKRSPEERKALKRINEVQSVDELQAILNLTRKEQETAQRLFDKLLSLRAKGAVGFDDLAQIRVFGVGDKTVARILKQASQGDLKINLLPIATDRTLAELILQERISGVGPKVASAIYDALMDTGTQFADADEMYRRIMPYIELRGATVGNKKKFFQNLQRLDFTYLPGMDRQPYMLPGEGDLPALPGGDRRGGTPRLPGLPSNSSDSSSDSSSTAVETGTMTIPASVKEVLPRTTPKGLRKPDIETNGTVSTKKVLPKTTPEDLWESDIETSVVPPVVRPILIESDRQPSVPAAKLKAQRIRNRQQTQDNIDLAIEEISALKDNLDNIYEAEIKQSKTGFLNRQTMSQKMTQTEARVAQITKRNIDDNRRVQKQQATSLIKNVEVSIEDLTQEIALGIDNPLADSSYSTKGKLERKYVTKIDKQIKLIDERVLQIESSNNLSVEDKKEIERLKTSLNSLKREVKNKSDRILKNPGSSTNIERERLQERSRGLIKEIQSLPDDALSKEFDKQGRLDLLNQIDTLPNSSLIKKIDNLVKQLENAPGQSIDKSNGALILTNDKLKFELLEQKERLLNLRNKQLTTEEKLVNSRTIRQRELIARQQKEFKNKLNEYESQYLKIEQGFQQTDSEVAKMVPNLEPSALDVTVSTRIAQSEKNIKDYSDRLSIAQRQIDLLKSDRWQDYAMSLANLEDSAGPGNLAGDFLSFDELVVARNKAIRKARAKGRKSVRQISGWGHNPKNVLLEQERNLVVLEEKLNSLLNQQQKLDSLAQDLVELASADPTKDYSELIDLINQRKANYKSLLQNNRALLQQSRQNLETAVEQDYTLQIGDSRPRTPNEIDLTVSKLNRRIDKKAKSQDRDRIVSVFDKLEQSGLDTGKFIEATKANSYDTIQQQIYQSLSEPEKRAIAKAVSKNALELSQDARILRVSRLHLYSVSRSLKQRKSQIRKEIVRSIPVTSNRQVSVLEKIETALRSDNIEEARNAASKLPQKVFAQIEPKLDEYRQITGSRSATSQAEIDVLAGVNSMNAEREIFISQVKGNLALSDRSHYDLAEITRAIEVNRVAIAKNQNRLSAVDFSNKLGELVKFIKLRSR